MSRRAVRPRQVQLRPRARGHALGGVITFDCGPDPVTITMTDTAKVVNTAPIVVLDGGAKVTLSGAGQRRIFSMNTCDPEQIWTTSHRGIFFLGQGIPQVSDSTIG